MIHVDSLSNLYKAFRRPVGLFFKKVYSQTSIVSNIHNIGFSWVTVTI